MKKEQQDATPTLQCEVVRSNKVYYPPYFAKRKSILNKQLIKKLEDAVKSDPIATDEHGVYKAGLFLHKYCIVDVRFEDDNWTLQIMSEQPINRLIINEIRYKFIPDNVFMALLLPPRKFDKLQKSVILYQIPNAVMGTEDQEEEAEE